MFVRLPQPDIHLPTGGTRPAPPIHIRAEHVSGVMASPNPDIKHTVLFIQGAGDPVITTKTVQGVLGAVMAALEKTSETQEQILSEVLGDAA